PPRPGGAGAHVDGLTRALGQAGHEVVVLTVGHRGAPADQVVPTASDSETAQPVRVLRANIDLPWIPDEFHVASAASAGHQIVQLITALGRDDRWAPDVVHCHSWEVAWPAQTLAALYGVPLVTTFHTTMRGQHGGSIPPGEPSTIHA